MRTGVVLLRSSDATARHQSQTCLVLSHNGFSCHARERFDGLMIVAFERDKNEPDIAPDEVRQILQDDGVWQDEWEVKAFD